MKTDFKSFIDYYVAKTGFSISLIAKILGIKEQSLRNKLCRNPDITLSEIKKLLSYVNGSISIKFPFEDDAQFENYDEIRNLVIDEMRPKIKSAFNAAMMEYEGVLYPNHWVDILCDCMKED